MCWLLTDQGTWEKRIAGRITSEEKWTTETESFHRAGDEKERAREIENWFFIINDLMMQKI